MAHPQPTTQQPITRDKLRYLLYRPEETPAGSPLVLFLHGSGERGDDLAKVTNHGLARVLETRNPFAEPLTVVSPQCPADSWWTLELAELSDLLAHAVTRYQADPTRIYLTGLSMGGFGAWQLAQKCPERFAAVVPICGGGLPKLAAKLTGVPVWVFHGAKDKVVPLSASQQMVAALEAAGGDVRFTVYHEAAHDSWSETYDNPELYRWLLAQRRLG